VAKAKQLTLRWPLGGVERRGAFQASQPFSTPAALNVYPDDTAQGRARGGARPGLSKALTTDRDSFYQCIGSVNTDRGTTSAAYQRVLFAVSNGHLLYMNEGDTTWDATTTGNPHFNPSVPLQYAAREQKVYFADYANITGSDLAVDSGYNRVVTSASVGAWSNAGITSANVAQWSLEVLSGTGADVGTDTVAGYGVTFTEGTVAVAADAGGSIVTKTGGTAWPAWAAAGTITISAVAYTVKTRTSDDVILLDNVGITVGAGASHSLALLTTQLLLSGSAGTVSSTNLTYRLHRTPKVWDPVAGTVTTWTASTGTVPNDCKLICEYRDRIVLAGDVYAPHRWYASRSGDPLDFNYGEFDATSAAAYSNYIGGQIGEPITALIPHGYDCLILGAQDATYVMRGDPANTGSHLIKVDDVVGVLSANAWCKTAADETVLLTRDGLYYMPSGCGVPPTSISREKLPEELIGIDPDSYFVNLAYDPLLRCIHIWLVENDGNPAVTTQWLYSWDHKAFWPITLPATYQPSAVYDFSPLATANKSSVLLGGYDGIVRQFNKAAEDDDGTDFTSYVRIGPFMLSPNSDNKGIIQGLRIVMGTGSGAATWDVGAASTMEGVADQLAAATNIYTGTIGAYKEYPRVSGHAGMLEIGANGAATQWIFEEAVVQVREAGRMR
jgi:hypothetical protein